MRFPQLQEAHFAFIVIDKVLNIRLLEPVAPQIRQVPGWGACFYLAETPTLVAERYNSSINLSRSQSST